jgi:serine/threonine-protein kinase HipA
LEEIKSGKEYSFSYHENYDGPPVSLTMPVSMPAYTFDHFPPFFDGLLPEGVMLEGLLRQKKIDAKDYFSQLVVVGKELVGTITVEEVKG